MNRNDAPGKNAERPPRQNTSYTSGRRYRETSAAVTETKKNKLVNNLVSSHKQKELAKNAAWNESVEYVKGSPDWIFGTLVLILVALGIVMIFSASFPVAAEKYGNSFFYAGRQIKWALIGIVVMLIAMYAVPINFFKKVAPIIYAVGGAALIAVLIFGSASKGAKRWIELGGQRIQPSEFAKFTLIILLAWYADKFGHLYRDAETGKEKLFYGVIVPAVPIFIYAGLVMLENHLSGTIIIVMIGLFVMFLAGASVKWTAIAYAALGVPALIGYVIMKPYALERVYTFVNKENADILGERWQTYQGTLAIGSGGILGLGFGQSRQKYSYVAEAQNDFIFTIWCEEMGFIGALLVLALFAALIGRGYYIAMRSTDTFSSLLVFGIVTQVAIQVILNIMVVTDIIPNTGISLPFLSYGGSSLLMFMGEMGLVMGVSRRSFQKKQ